MSDRTSKIDLEARRSAESPRSVETCSPQSRADEQDLDRHSPRPRVAVVIVNYESAGVLRDLHLRTPPLRTAAYIVVDNSTTTAGRAECRALSEQFGWVYRRSSGNVGFGAAVNAGFEESLRMGCTHVLLLNPDASIDEENFATLLDRAQQAPASVLSPVIRDQSEHIWFAGAVMDRRRGTLRHVQRVDASRPNDWLTGACLLIPVAAWRMLNGFDEDYFLYWEDVEFTSRWRRLGGGIEVVANASATHMVGATQAGAGRKSLIYARFNSRNRLRFAARNLSGIDLLLWIASQPGYVLDQARIADRSRGVLPPIGAVLRGSLEGLTQVPRNRRATSGLRKLLAQSSRAR